MHLVFDLRQLTQVVVLDGIVEEVDMEIGLFNILISIFVC